MTFDDYKHICFTHGIHPEIIEACREFVVKHEMELNGATKYNRTSLGYAELTDIETPSQSIKEMQDAIHWAITDYDALGRSKQKLLMRKFKQDPGKHFRRLTLKSFYLHGGTV